MRGYRRAGKARRRRCASFAPPEPRRYSGKSRAEPRPTLRRLLAEISAGDVVTVTRLDRLARSTRDLLNTLATITDKKAGFRSGAATTAYRGGGMSGMAEAAASSAGSAAMSPLRRAAASLRESFAAGGRAVTGEGGAAGSAAEAGAAAGQAGALGP